MKLGVVNILETGTVTVTSEESSYPSVRLYDRMFARNWQATSTANQTIHVDQGASPVAIDTLIIPSSHNFAGCSMSWQYSTDNVSFSDMVTGWTQSGSGIIVKTGAASQTARYWRMVVSGASSAVYCGEIMMTILTEYDNPLYGSSRSRDRSVVRTVAYSGTPHFVKQAASKRRIVGTLKLTNSTKQTAFELLITTWDGYKPFYLQDHNSDQYFAEFVSEPELIDEGPVSRSYRFDVREVG